MTRSWRDPLSRPTVLLALLLAAVLTTGADWPTYLHDPQRSSGVEDMGLSPSTAAQLGTAWEFPTGKVIAASPTVVGGTVYIGSWNGYEYALNASNGQPKWKTFLGITVVCDNPPMPMGVSSTATVDHGVVYVGGGDGNWYALSAATGKVLWSVPTGDTGPKSGHYNWSSPLIYQGYAYVGVASGADCPLVQGQLLKVSLSEHRIVATFDAVPPGQLGGGIWTSPAVDPDTNTIYVTTGNSDNPLAPCAQPYAPAIVALDAATLKVKDWWQIPSAQQNADNDWSTTPTLFHDASGNPMVAAAAKNGDVYAFKRTDLGAGPIWARSVAAGGYSPENGDATVSSAAFDGERLYVAGGTSVVGNGIFAGSVRALDPASGRVLWEQGTAGIVVAALAYVHGLLLDGDGDTLEVRDARSGAVLYREKTGGPIYSAPSVSDGRIFFGSTDGRVYALAAGARRMSPVGRARSRTAVPAGSNGGSLGAWYGASTQPASFPADQQVAYQLKVVNTGGMTWPASGSNAVQLDVHFAPTGGGYTGASAASSWMGDRKFVLPFAVRPGASVTFALLVTAPSAPGKYTLEYQLVQSGDRWFPQFLDTAASVETFAAGFATAGQPGVFSPCGSSTYTITARNTGSSTWHAQGADPVVLSVRFKRPNVSDTSNAPDVAEQWFYLGNDIEPGQSVTFEVTINAPPVAGSYTLEYRMLMVGIAYSPQYLDSPVSVQSATVALVPGG